MADINLQDFIDQLQKLGGSTPEILKKVELAFDNLTKSAEQFAGLKFKEITGEIKSYATAIKELVPTSDALYNKSIKNGDAFDKVTDGLGKLLAVTTRFNGFDQMAVKSGSAVNTIDKQFAELRGKFGTWGEASAALLGSGFTQIAGMSAKSAEKFFSNAAQAQKLEAAYINLQAATGGLNSVFDINGKISDNLNNKIAQFGANILQTQKITGETTPTVANFASELYTIPGALNAFIDLGPDKKIDSLTAAMTAARGAGRDLQDILGTMTKAYEDLGNSQGKVVDGTEKGIKMFSLMSETSNKLGLRFVDTQRYLSGVADTFKFSGDNTEAAAKILGRFSDSLQSTGLTAKASMEIIGGMTESIHNLSIGTKALISQRTGGPGGLQGAFQVENLIRQGKSDQVAQMLEKTLRQQFGGRIYTQEEAGRSPEAAAQFMRQRSLIQSGAFGQLAKTDEQATRLLEALKAGPSATADIIKDGLGAAKDVNAKGLEFQKTQINILSSISSSADEMVGLQGLLLLEEARKTIGNKNAAMNKSMDEAYDMAVSDIFSRSKEPGSVKDQNSSLNRSAFKSIEDVGPIAEEGVSHIMNVVEEYMASSKKTIGEAITQQVSSVKGNKQIQSDISDSLNAGRRGEDLRTAVQTSARTVQTMKHEVANKPLDVNITVSTNDNTDVDVQTNYPSAKVRKQITSMPSGSATINR